MTVRRINRTTPRRLPTPLAMFTPVGKLITRCAAGGAYSCGVRGESWSRTTY